MYKKPLTLCHGDVHMDNIFFSDDFPTGLKMIDFGNICIAQAPRVGAFACHHRELDMRLPADLQSGFDVAYFLGQNIDPEMRRNVEKELTHFVPYVNGHVKVAHG